MILLTCGNEETISHKTGPRLNETVVVIRGKAKGVKEGIRKDLSSGDGTGTLVVGMIIIIHMCVKLNL